MTTQPRRIVSLLPAATEIVAALGAGDRLIGITHECDHPRPLVTNIACVTTTPIDRIAPTETNNEAARIDQQVRAVVQAGDAMFHLDAERIAALQPDLILTQALCDVCAVDERDVRAIAATLTPQPKVITLGGITLNGVLDDIATVAAALGIQDEGEELLAGLHVRLRTVHRQLKAARAPRPRVVVVEWTDPIYAAGHWVPDLVHRAGGTDAVASTGEHSTIRTMNQLRAARAELILFSPCGYTAAQAATEARAVLARPEWSWAALLPAWAIDANALMTRPGPRLVDGVETMAAIFHPTLFPPPTPAAAIRLAS